MSDDPAPGGEHPTDATPGTLGRDERSSGDDIDRDRRRRRAEVFGDVLPEGTQDERADGWSEREPGGDATEEWLRRQVPPHHG